MYDELSCAINESMFEFALVCQEAIKAGWEFVEVNHGERRLGVSPSLTIRKGSEIKRIYNSDDLARILESSAQDSSRDNM